MKRGEEIKAVIFDVGGVLQLGEKPRYNAREIHTSGIHERLAKKLGLTIDQYFDSIDSYYARSIEGLIDEKTLLSVISLNLNYPKNKLKKFFENSYKKIIQKNNELYKIAKKLKKKGYKIAILSDQWHLSKNSLIPEKDKKIFDEVIISCEVGLRKPNPEIYKLLLKKLGVKTKEAIFIDNQPWNIIPAHKLGLKTILFIDNKKTKEQLGKFGIKL